MLYKITENVLPLKDDVVLGDQIQLSNQTQEVVHCIRTGVKMLNIDADQLAPGDLTFIKKLGLTISNPETEEPVAIGVEYHTVGRAIADFFETSEDEEEEEDDDDSSFFSGGIFGGSSSGGGFGGGFGGFGGGGFSGGGASGGF